MWSPTMLLLPLLLSSALAMDTCQPEAMARCTDPLKVVTDNKDLGFATSIQELTRMCPKLMDGLRCIDDFTYRCLDASHRRYFNTLYQGTTQVIVDLCTEGSYQRAYLRHAPCMRRMQNGYEKCADQYQNEIKRLNEQGDNEDSPNNGGVSKLCCSFEQYLKCSEKVVNATCGSDTAAFTKTFLDRMAGPLIHGHCRPFEHDGGDCGQMDSDESGGAVLRRRMDDNDDLVLVPNDDNEEDQQQSSKASISERSALLLLLACVSWSLN